MPNQVVANRRRRSSGPACLLIDDMIATGSTIVKASEVLFRPVRPESSWATPR